MNNYTIDEDITLMYVTAASFPDGIMAAFQQLQSKASYTAETIYYGISFPDKNGSIIYKAAAEAKNQEEAAEAGLETFIVKKGTYACILVQDFMKHTAAVGEAFQQLLKHPQLDPQGFCLEMYRNKTDVQCMVPLK